MYSKDFQVNRKVHSYINNLLKKTFEGHDLSKIITFALLGSFVSFAVAYFIANFMEP